MGPSTDLDRDVSYLRNVQYRDSTELAKRANLHVAYRTAPKAGFDWFAEMIEWPEGARVLDVGCGSGLLWEHAATVAPAGIELTLVDLSPGMVDEAVDRAKATGRFASVVGEVCDARELSFPDASFDVVTSTYALYHVPEPERAVAHLARVVTDEGTVGIMTNGSGHLAELDSLRQSTFGPAAAYAINDAFPPSVASAVLGEHFDEVSWRRYDDELRVTDTDDLLAFLTSSPPADAATPAQLADLRATIDAEISTAGHFTVSKHTGALISRRPRRKRQA